MNNEYIVQPLDPLEISFSKDKCNINCTLKPINAMLLDTNDQIKSSQIKSGFEPV
jgi:hypothetical protein